VSPTLDKPVPWGRTLAEYRAMFSLSDEDLARPIIDVGAGPASFTAELGASGGHVVACDPLYARGAGEIRRATVGAEEAVRALLKAEPNRFVWHVFSDLDALVAARRGALERFLTDYEARPSLGRYCAASLPRLPFPDRSFGLALCSHLLFLYSAALDLEAHVAAILELARVAPEVRIFPLLTMEGTPSPHLAGALARARGHGLSAEVVGVDYEVQAGGRHMLRVTRTQDF
jgi:SAM-dependent methyltransferase